LFWVGRVKNVNIHECFEIPSEFLSDYIKINHEYKETQIGFDPKIYSIRDNTNIHGWFQSPKYFHEIKNELIEILKFKKNLLDVAENLWNFLNLKKPCVSIHVRRGDYVQNPIHPLCEKEYYEKAKKIFKNHQFLVFSDDPNWCKKNMKEIVVNSGNDLVDFILMNKCDHHIIANSTFSWWAAWLNKSKKNIVVAPKKWFGSSKTKFYSFHDIYCDNWIVM
jgi:hypothetical protein